MDLCILTPYNRSTVNLLLSSPHFLAASEAFGCGFDVRADCERWIAVFQLHTNAHPSIVFVHVLNSYQRARLSILDSIQGQPIKTTSSYSTSIQTLAPQPPSTSTSTPSSPQPPPKKQSPRIPLLPIYLPIYLSNTLIII